jgi:hypothetical protein
LIDEVGPSRLAKSGALSLPAPAMTLREQLLRLDAGGSPRPAGGSHHHHPLPASAVRDCAAGETPWA